MAEAASQASSSSSTITVKGSGSVLVPYDRASVRVSVVCHHASSVVSARDACASATAKYIEGLTDAGGLAVPAGQITTSRISISQEWDHNGKKRTFRGHRVANDVTVALKDLSAVGDVIDRSVGDVGKSLNSLHGPDFSVSSAETMKAEEQAYEDAYEHALKKASLLAAKQGRKVRVPAAWIREGDHYDGGPPPGPRMMRAFGGGEKTPVMAGEGSAVTRSITACFELQDAEA